MEIPKIKRDETKTKITNKNEIIHVLKYYSDEQTLINYKKALETQTKININEVQDLIKIIDERLNLLNTYNEVSKDYIKLNDFYKNNIYLIEDYMKEVSISTKIDSKLENLLINFLNFSISNEENGIQNDLNIQNLFNEFKRIFDMKKNSNDFKPEELDFFSQVNDIMNRKEALINKIDDDSMDYKENNYLTRTQVLSKVPYNNPGHSIDDNNLKVGGFIATTIILESSLVIALILALFAIFK